MAWNGTSSFPEPSRQRASSAWCLGQEPQMQHFSIAAILEAGPFLLKGLIFSLELTVVAFAGGLLLGIGLALVRHLKVPVASQIASAYITLIRAIPLIM